METLFKAFKENESALNTNENKIRNFDPVPRGYSSLLTEGRGGICNPE